MSIFVLIIISIIWFSAGWLWGRASGMRYATDAWEPLVKEAHDLAEENMNSIHELQYMVDQLLKEQKIEHH